MHRIDISYRRIARIAGPVLVTQLSHVVIGVVDTAMVGRLGVTALAAVGLGNLVVMWPLSFLVGLLIGVNTLVAQSVGGERPRDAGAAYGQGLWAGLAVASALVALIPLAPALLALAGASPEVEELATGYVRIRLLGAVGLALFAAADNFYRGVGRTSVPMWCGLAQIVVNCGLNYLLIFGALGAPRLGTDGAAWGTTTTQILVGLALSALVWSSRRHRRDFAIAEAWRLRAGIMRSFLRISLPVGFQAFLEMGAITVFCAAIARLGDAQLAATNAVIQIWSVTFMATFALSVGATTLVGQCVGAGEPDRGRRATARVTRLALGLAAVTGGAYLAWPAALMALFVEPAELPALLPYARPLLSIVTACLVFDMRFMVLAGALRGAGDTAYSMLTNLGSAWLVFVPATLWAAPRFGVEGAWSCLVLHTAVLAVLHELRYRGDAWLRPASEPSPKQAPAAALQPFEPT